VSRRPEPSPAGSSTCVGYRRFLLSRLVRGTAITRGAFALQDLCLYHALQCYAASRKYPGASKSLAATPFARATHFRVHPPAQFTIAPASDPHQPKSYVLPTFYGLEDTTSEFRAHDGPSAATEPPISFALEYLWNYCELETLIVRPQAQPDVSLEAIALQSFVPGCATASRSFSLR
jgi:hypothetical protein